MGSPRLVIASCELPTRVRNVLRHDPRTMSEMYETNWRFGNVGHNVSCSHDSELRTNRHVVRIGAKRKRHETPMSARDD